MEESDQQPTTEAPQNEDSKTDQENTQAPLEGENLPASVENNATDAPEAESTQPAVDNAQTSVENSQLPAEEENSTSPREGNKPVEESQKVEEEKPADEQNTQESLEVSDEADEQKLPESQETELKQEKPDENPEKVEEEKPTDQQPSEQDIPTEESQNVEEKASEVPADNKNEDSEETMKAMDEAAATGTEATEETPATAAEEPATTGAEETPTVVAEETPVAVAVETPVAEAETPAATGTEATEEFPAAATEEPAVVEAQPEAQNSELETKTSDEESAESTATVTFQIVPSSEVITVSSSLSTRIFMLKELVASHVQARPSDLLIRRNGEELDSEMSLLQLGVVANGTIQFEILTATEDITLKSVTPIKQTGGSDFITVKVQRENNEVSNIVVEIERQSTKKVFLGGYRHKLSGSEYHHASAQTNQKPPKISPIKKFTRDCQTVFERNKVQQTTSVTSTQMPKTGCYISTEHDKILVARKYVSYDEYMKRRIKAVIVLQSYFRRWQARHLVNELKLDRDRRIEWERQEEIRKKREKEERVKRELEKRIHPKTREDFDLLYAALERWRLEELGNINAEFTGPERKAALCALLEQEAQLIGSIDRRKIDAFKEGKEKKILQFLDKAAAPKRWKAYDGRFTEMDTQYTIRAKELRDIYNSINMKYLTQDERLDVLLTLKHTVKEHDCKLTREITELIDREADLLMRGMRDENLEGLRKRISTLFLQYCKNPLFNPEAARLLKVPQDPSTLVKDIYFCPSSNQYLPSTEFKLTSKSRVVGKSRKALQLDNEARTRQDYSHYKVMLRALRRSEESYHDNSSIAFLIQEKDLQYLIENIWAAQSVLSSWDDLFDLILVRWDKDEEWSPWNTILLTKDESMAHLKLDHLEEAYSKQFISKVSHKHTLARVHFAKLPGMAEALRKKTTGSRRLPGGGAVEGVSVY